LQTYGVNGEVIPLPLDTELPGPSRGRVKEIRAFEKERDQQTKSKRKSAVDSGVVCLPRPPGGPMPTIPDLGRPGARIRRAPKNADEADADLLRRLEESRLEESRRSEESQKRKGEASDSAPKKR
jgi:hypothetical protein